MPDNRLLFEASKTPESPATLSSDTAAETERVFVPDELARERMPIGGGVSLIGDSGGSTIRMSYIETAIHTFNCKLLTTDVISGLRKICDTRVKK